MAAYPRNGNDLEHHPQERLAANGPSEPRCGLSNDRGDEEQDREDRHQEGRAPADQVHEGGIDGRPHDLAVVDELEHDDQDEREEDAVQGLGEEHDRDEGKAGPEDGRGAHPDHDQIDGKKSWCLSGPPIDAGGPA